jgi:hypothetical protein
MQRAMIKLAGPRILKIIFRIIARNQIIATCFVVSEETPVSMNLAPCRFRQVDAGCGDATRRHAPT